MPAPDLLFPFLPHAADYRQEYKFFFERLYHQWHDANAATQTEFRFENIRFERDPHWRNRLFSIQSAHDRNHWVWKATSLVWAGCAGSI
jgi:hypothetical protein